MFITFVFTPYMYVCVTFSITEHNLVWSMTESCHFSGSPLKKGNARLFWGLSDEFPAVALVGLGSTDAAYDPNEEIDEARENIRIAAGGIS